MIGVKLGKHLSTKAAIANRVSQNNWPGIYLRHRPQKAPLPSIVITVIGGAPDYSLNGEISDLPKVVQVDVDSHKQIEPIEIGELVRTEIGAFLTSATWDDVTVQSVTIENERDQEFPPTDNSNQWVYRRSVDYRITYDR